MFDALLYGCSSKQQFTLYCLVLLTFLYFAHVCFLSCPQLRDLIYVSCLAFILVTVILLQKNLPSEMSFMFHDV